LVGTGGLEGIMDGDEDDDEGEGHRDGAWPTAFAGSNSN